MWFLCKNCGKRAFKRRFTVNSWMRSDMAKRTDIEFSNSDMHSSFKRMNDA
jgi:hypothetical protein